MFIFFAAAVAIFLLFISFRQIGKITGSKKPEIPADKVVDSGWRTMLEEQVHFYQELSTTDKPRFEHKIMEFLSYCTVTGVDIEVDDNDRVLVAAGAVIPIFNFPDWSYSTISEVLLYPDTFDHHYHTEGEGRQILGMVGEGVLQGKMILSKRALYNGFQANNKSNTAIHEFVHLIDKSDGYTDGVPDLLLKHQYVMPWLEAIHKNVEEIRKGDSDISDYAATNNQEFLAVVSEYFFEQPDLLQKKHPDLYKYMTLMFGKQLENNLAKNQP